MTLQGGEKIAGKWAHLKAAEEGRIRLDYECREKGETMKKQKERAEGKRRFFHFAKANGPSSFAEGNLREERSTNAAKEYKSDVVVLTKAWTAQEGEKSRGRVRRN